MGFGSMMSPAKILEKATFHELYKDTKNTRNVPISTAATSLEARKQMKKKGATTTHGLWKYAIQKMFKCRDF